MNKSTLTVTDIEETLNTFLGNTPIRIKKENLKAKTAEYFSVSEAYYDIENEEVVLVIN